MGKLRPIKKAKIAPLNYFGNYMTRRREELKISNWEISRRMKVPGYYTFMWESGRSRPSIQFIKKLAKALEVTDLEIRKQLVKADVTESLYKYGFTSLDDQDRYRIEIRRKNHKHVN